MDIFTALGEPTRKNIIEILAINGQLSAKEIYSRFSVSASAISQHLKILKEAKLVIMQKLAQKRIYQINTEKIIELEDWAKQMKSLWDQRFNALEKLLEEEKKKLQ
jgi:DNA-binding transcriptional ArsR family regulator